MYPFEGSKMASFPVGPDGGIAMLAMTWLVVPSGRGPWVADRTGATRAVARPAGGVRAPSPGRNASDAPARGPTIALKSNRNAEATTSPVGIRGRRRGCTVVGAIRGYYSHVGAPDGSPLRLGP